MRLRLFVVSCVENDRLLRAEPAHESPEFVAPLHRVVLCHELRQLRGFGVLDTQQRFACLPRQSLERVTRLTLQPVTQVFRKVVTGSAQRSRHHFGRSDRLCRLRSFHIVRGQHVVQCANDMVDPERLRALARPVSGIVVLEAPHAHAPARASDGAQSTAIEQALPMIFRSERRFTVCYFPAARRPVGDSFEMSINPSALSLAVSFSN